MEATKQLRFNFSYFAKIFAHSTSKTYCSIKVHQATISKLDEALLLLVGLSLGHQVEYIGQSTQATGGSAEHSR